MDLAPKLFFLGLALSVSSYLTLRGLLVGHRILQALIVATAGLPQFIGYSSDAYLLHPQLALPPIALFLYLSHPVVKSYARYV